MKKMLMGALVFLLSMGLTRAEEQTLKVGHVGHDHQIALFLAATQGEKLKDKTGGVWLEEIEKSQAYRLIENGKSLCVVSLLKVGGGAGMPSALARNEIEVGLGGVAAVVSAIDGGADMKIIAPLNCDGDMLLLLPELNVKGWDGFLKFVRESKTPVKIGYKAPRAVAYLIFIRALAEAGLTCGDLPVSGDGKPVNVVVINLQKTSNMLPSLEKKIVDGMVMNQPEIALAESKGLGKTVCDLRDLPPAGKWLNHPCCCVAATGAALRDKRALVLALLKTIVAGGDFANTNPEETVKIVSDWTKLPVEVESISIPTVNYQTVFTDGWRQGMLTWFEMMTDLNHFSKNLKDKTPEELDALVTDFSLLREIAPETDK